MWSRTGVQTTSPGLAAPRHGSAPPTAEAPHEPAPGTSPVVTTTTKEPATTTAQTATETADEQVTESVPVPVPTTLSAQVQGVQRSNQDGAQRLAAAINAGSLPQVLTVLGEGMGHLLVNQVLADGGTALQSAARQGHRDIVAALLDQGAQHDPGIKTPFAPPLHRAALGGHLAVVQLLLERKVADVNSRSDSGATAFYNAIGHGFLDIAECLRSHGADMELRQKDGWSPLLSACFDGTPETVDWLLKQGVNIDQKKEPEGWTLLHAALRNARNPGVIDVLQKSNPTAFREMCNARDRSGFAPLSYAAERGMPEVVLRGLRPTTAVAPIQLTPPNYQRCWVIRCCDGDPELEDEAMDLGPEAGMEIVPYGDGVKSLSLEELKALPLRPGDSVALVCHTARHDEQHQLMARLGEHEVVPLTDLFCMLFEKNIANIFFSGCQGTLVVPPLWNRFQFDTSMRRPLDNRFEGLNITVAASDDDVIAPSACRALNLWLRDCETQRATGKAGDALQRLSELEINTLCAEGQTLVLHKREMPSVDDLTRLAPPDREAMLANLLSTYAANGDLTNVKKLVEQHGVSPNAQAAGDYSALYSASAYGHVDVVGYLVEQEGVDLNVLTDEFATPLWIACSDGNVAVVQLLLDKGADCESSDEEDWTPLHVACKKGHLEIVELLLAKGADVTATTDDGDTPLALARRAGWSKIVDALQR